MSRALSEEIGGEIEADQGLESGPLKRDEVAARTAPQVEERILLFGGD